MDMMAIKAEQPQVTIILPVAPPSIPPPLLYGINCAIARSIGTLLDVPSSGQMNMYKYDH